MEEKHTEDKIPPDVTAIKMGTYPPGVVGLIIWRMKYMPLVLLQGILIYYFCYKLDPHVLTTSLIVVATALSTITFIGDIFIALRIYNQKRYYNLGKIGVYMALLSVPLGIIAVFI